VRGIARSTVKREMLRSLRHIAETIDAVMVAEGIEHVEDVIALRDLGLRYGQGYYMARPAPPFVTLKDEVRAELRSIQTSGRPPQPLQQNDDDEEEDRDLPIPQAKPSARSQVFSSGSSTGIPRNAFGRAEDEITSDFTIPGATPASTEPRRPRASDPPTNPDAGLAPWQPLTDDEATGEALLESLKKKDENTPDGERGPGRPGLN
jgi:hypothetical protein